MILLYDSTIGEVLNISKYNISQLTGGGKYYGMSNPKENNIEITIDTSNIEWSKNWYSLINSPPSASAILYKRDLSICDGRLLKEKTSFNLYGSFITKLTHNFDSDDIILEISSDYYKFGDISGKLLEIYRDKRISEILS